MEKGLYIINELFLFYSFVIGSCILLVVFFMFCWFSKAFEDSYAPQFISGFGVSSLKQHFKSFTEKMKLEKKREKKPFDVSIA